MAELLSTGVLVRLEKGVGMARWMDRVATFGWRIYIWLSDDMVEYLLYDLERKMDSPGDSDTY